MGLRIDEKLSWDIQFEFLNNKCKKILNIIKFLRGTWWGGHPQILLNIYKAMIRGVMGYSCFIYNFSNKKKNTFNRIQYKALRLALGYRVSTLIRVLHTEACEPPLTIRSYFLASKFILKIFANSNHSLYDILFNLNYLVDSSNKFRLKNEFSLLNAFKVK